LLAYMSEAEESATELLQQIMQNINSKFDRQEQFLTNIKWKIKQSLTNKISVKTIDCERKKNRLKTVTHKIFFEQQNKLALIERGIEAHSPTFLLKHGYSITTLNGKRLLSAKNIKSGEKIRTFLTDGEINSLTI